MKLFFQVSLLALLFGASVSLPAIEPSDWQPSTLRPETIEKVQAAVKVYERCVNDQTKAHLNDKDDSRRVTDLILRNCEAQLLPVKQAFAAEKVPDTLSDRYMRSRRSRVAQQVLRLVMATQAAQSAEKAK